MTNGHTHHYYLGESTVILGAKGVILNVYSIPLGKKNSPKYVKHQDFIFQVFTGHTGNLKPKLLL